jgi:hypothetical protein
MIHIVLPSTLYKALSAGFALLWREKIVKNGCFSDDLLFSVNLGGLSRAPLERLQERGSR